MKILFFINTPAQLYFYIPIVESLRSNDHQIIMLLREYRETLEIAEKRNLHYEISYRFYASKMRSLCVIPIDVCKIIAMCRSKKPDILVGGGLIESFISSISGIPIIQFMDGEPDINFFQNIQTLLSVRLADKIVTPKFFKKDFGVKHVKVDSFKELAYLHPEYFRAQHDIIEDLGLEDDKFVVLRINAFDAFHDIGVKGFTSDDVRNLINALKDYARVIISTERELKNDLEEYRIDFQKDRIHDLLYYAGLCVTETGTMTTEASLLGTPTIIVHPNVHKFGNFIELEKSGLICFYKRSELAIEKAIELIKKEKNKDIWRERSRIYLDKKENITDFMVKLIENYRNNNCQRNY